MVRKIQHFLVRIVYNPPKLSPSEESNIRAWLTHIKETDPTIIDEILKMCRAELKHREYFLKRSEEVLKSGNNQ